MKIRNILIILILIIVSIGIASATTYKHEIGTAFKINNQVYIVTGYTNIGYTVYSDAGYGTFPFQTLDVISPIEETISQKIKGFFNVATLSIVGGLPAPDMYGDVNNDGQVTIVDAQFIAQYTVQTRTFNQYELVAADVNNDGQVTIVDAQFIAQYTVQDYKNAPNWRIGNKITYCVDTTETYRGYVINIYCNGYVNVGTNRFNTVSQAKGYIDSIIPPVDTPLPVTTISTPIPKPFIVPPALNKIWDSLISWLSSWFPLLSIAGSSTVNVPINQPYSTSMSLAFGAPDTVYGDGTYTAKFGQWIVVDSNKNLKYESGWTNELVSSPYIVTATYTPTSAGKYFLVGLINKQTYTWNGAQWVMVETIETKEVQELVVGLPNVPVTKPIGTTTYLNDLFVWLKGLFSWLPW